MKQVALVLGIFVLGFLTENSAFGEDAGTRSFDVPAGPATETLKFFSEQAQVQLLYATDDVRDVKTNAVSGKFTPAEALNRMLDGTPLTAIPDETPGAFSIKRRPTPDGKNADSGQAPLAPLPAGAVVSDHAAAGDQPIKMSPFEVESTEDQGYRARSTLAGSRVQTNLNDLAGPITVVTKDFLDDIGAIDVNDILNFEVGAEGAMNYQAFSVPAVRGTTDSVSQNPNASTRGRGLAPFDITQDYFFSLAEGISDGFVSSGVGFDTYNLDNVTIIRGADSILAGLGSPSGIINYAPQLALLNKNSADISYRFGSYGDERAMLNANIVAKKNVLAFRIAAVDNNRGFEEKPSYDHDQRYYLAMTFQPFKTTTIRASYQATNINEHLPSTFTPEDDITQWIQLGKPISATWGGQPTGPNSQYLGTGLGLFTAVPNLYISNTGSIIGAYDDTTGGKIFLQQNLSNVPIWQPLHFANNVYGDWQKINTNDTLEHNRLSQAEVSIDQEVFPHFSINIAYFKEGANNFEPANTYTGGAFDTAELVDVNKQLPNGQANPYFGDTYMGYDGVSNQVLTTASNEVERLTANYNLDLNRFNKWLGHYSITGLLEGRTTKSDTFTYDQMVEEMPTGEYGPGTYTYNGGTPANGYYATIAEAEPILVNRQPVIGTSAGIPVGATSYSTDYQPVTESKTITKLNTSAFLVQGYLFQDLAVGTFGLRRDVDHSGFYSVASGIGVPLPSVPNDQYSNGPYSVVQAQTKTEGIVVHGPKIGRVDLSWLTLAYNQSDNFIPNAGSVDLNGKATLAPVGLTKDYSISVNLLNDRLSAKIDWYTSKANNNPNATASFLAQWSMPFEILPNNGFTGSGAFYDLASQAGHKNDYQSGIDNNLLTGDPRLINSYTDNNISKGMEFELTFNITRNWRLFGTVTREQVIETNIAPSLSTLINSRVAYWKSIGIWDGTYTTTHDWSGQPETAQQVYDLWILPSMLSYESADGRPSQDLHHYMATLVTNYQFDRGLMKGFGFGAGLRYQDRTIIGNPAILTPVNGVPTLTGLNLSSPYTTPATTTIEAWLTYARRIYHDRYTLAFRLQANNLQTGGGYTPVSANSDGTHQLFTITPPRTFYFTTELKY